MFYGIGPVCGKRYGIVGITQANLSDQFESIREKLFEVYWRGFVPKSAVKTKYEDFHTISFTYAGKLYRVVTSDETKVKEIYEKSDEIISDQIEKG